MQVYESIINEMLRKIQKKKKMRVLSNSTERKLKLLVQCAVYDEKPNASEMPRVGRRRFNSLDNQSSQSNGS